MPFVAVPNVVEVQIRAVVDDQHIENRHFVDVHEPVTDLLMSSVGGVAASWVDPLYVNTTNLNLTFTEIVVTDMSSEDGAEITIPVNVTGAQDSAPYPNETSLCVSLKTGLRGRSRRGRMFLFPPSAAQVLPPNKAQPSYVTAAITIVQDLINAYDTSGFAMSVVSFISDGAPRVTPLVTRITAASLVDNILDSMRSRKPGNGS